MKSLVTAGLISTMLVSSAFAQAENAEGKAKKKADKGSDRSKQSKVDIFNGADADKNDSLSREEYAAILQGPKQIEKHFEKFDENNDSQLSQKEFDQAIEEVYWFKVTRKAGKDWISTLDQDKNGVLNFEEYKTLQAGKAGETAFGRIDKDGNGSLTEEEFNNHIQNVAKPKKAGGEKKNKAGESNLK